MRTLIVGDHFLSSESFRRAIEEIAGDYTGTVDEVAMAGKGTDEQHGVQQVMEKDGPEAVDTPTEIVDALAGVELLVVHFAPVSEAVLEAGADLKAVFVARAGYENVNVEEAGRRGVAVVNIQGRNADAVAEQAVGFMIAVPRNIVRADARIKAGHWGEDLPGPVHELGGRTIGLVGFGHVGRRLARRLSGFDVRLLVYDPYVDGDVIAGLGGIKADDMDEVFAEADIVSLHARLTDETRGFIGEHQFARMKPTGYFVNNARSRMVDYDALLEALRRGRIAGAALDVHDDEPLPPDSPWRDLDNVVVTPHIAGMTVQMQENSYRLVAEAVREFAETGRCEHTVNAAALGAR